MLLIFIHDIEGQNAFFMSEMEFMSHIFLDNKVNSRKVAALWKFFSWVLPKNIQDTDDKQNSQYFVLHTYINNYLFIYLTVIFGPTFHSLKIFKLQILYMCIYLCVGRCGHATSWEWRSRDNFEVWFLIFSYVGPGAGTQAIRLGSKCPHSLSQAFPFAPCSLIWQAQVHLFPFLVESSTLPSFLLWRGFFSVHPTHMAIYSHHCVTGEFKAAEANSRACDWLGLQQGSKISIAMLIFTLRCASLPFCSLHRLLHLRSPLGVTHFHRF